MATTKLPRYTRPCRLKSGQIAYYWEPPAWARPVADATGKKMPQMRHGRACPVEAENLGADLATAIERAAIQNEALDAWRAGAEAKLRPGSVAWLFDWYRQQDRYTSKSAKTRKDYEKLMRALQDEKMKAGTFGQRRAAAVTAEAADTIYKRWRTRNGERQATYAMQVCRLVWNWAKRHHHKTSVTFNPFEKMALSSVAAEGNRATSRDEYDLYRQTARKLGWQNMATAAALSFELCQRVWDVFGFVDPDGVKKRGFTWSDYSPGETIAYRQSKTGKPMEIPLTTKIGQDVVHLFPTLEEELARTKQTADVIVVDESTGSPLTYEQMNKRHRKICDEAGLPRDMTFTGFRHGGSTELGDAGVADIRPITGHLQLNTTAIYNKLSKAKAARAAAIRQQYLRELSESLSEPVSECDPKSTAK